MIVFSENNREFQVDEIDYELTQRYKWYVIQDKQTEYVRRSDGISFHQLLLTLDDNHVVDHINGDGLDNQRHNLRCVTLSVNAHNRKNRNELGYKGVHIQGNKFRARIVCDGKRKSLGMFDTAAEAARAYDTAAIILFGDNATLNFPWAK